MRRALSRLLLEYSISSTAARRGSPSRPCKPWPDEPVVVNKLCIPENASAVVLAEADAPLKDVHPSVVPSSKSYVATTEARTGLLASNAHDNATMLK
jgi:hypothetical protein